MTVLAIAHRAGNDLDALRAACALGVDVLEADVHVRRRRLELRHSKHLRPLPLLWDQDAEGRLVLTSTRAAQLTLDALLDAHDSSAGLMLDLKGPGRVGHRTAALVTARSPSRPVLVCSRYWPGVAVAAQQDWARPVLTARNRPELERLLRRVRAGRAPFGASVHRSLLDRRVVSRLREGVELVMTWGVNDLALLHEVLDVGVNGVISDSTEVLSAVLARRDPGDRSGLLDRLRSLGPPPGPAGG